MGSENPAISVAMCTYNGAAFVKEQLDSIATQILAPYEIVVCDDGSSDDTLRIVRQWASPSALPLRLHENPERLGTAKNFEQAIGLCEGEFIALADQDDVWLPEKLARLHAAMSDGAPYAFCDARVVDAGGAPSGHRSVISRVRGVRDRSLLDRRFPLRLIAEKFERGDELELMMKRDFIYGTTLMFRADVRELVLPVPATYSHDTWIVNVLACLGMHGAPVLEPLVLYRRHTAQASGGLAAPKPVPYPERIDALEELRAQIIALGDTTGRPPDPRAFALMDDKLRYLQALADVEGEPMHQRAMTAAGEVLSGRWRRYSPRTFR